MYTKYIYAVCTDSVVPLANQLAAVVGYKGSGPAFGGARGIGARVIGSGSTTPTHWLLYTIANEDREPYVEEFRRPAPHPLLVSAGATEEFLAACKAGMSVTIVDLQPDVDAYARKFLAANNLELMPE